KFILIGLAILNTGHSISWAQEQQYLVAGYNNALPNPAAIAEAGGIWMGEIPSIGVALVRSSDSNFLKKGRAHPSVELATVDPEVSLPDTELNTEELAGVEDLSPTAEEHGVHQGTPPNDPFYPFQWNLKAIGADVAYSKGNKGNGAVVALIDSGIDCNHEDLVGKVIAAKSFVPDHPTTCDLTNSNSHGTQMA